PRGSKNSLDGQVRYGKEASDRPLGRPWTGQPTAGEPRSGASAGVGPGLFAGAVGRIRALTTRTAICNVTSYRARPRRVGERGRERGRGDVHDGRLSRCTQPAGA